MKDKNLRRTGMGMSTLLGLRAQGFFSPYRHADQVRAPGSYGALEEVFAAAWPMALDRADSMQQVLDQIVHTVGEIAGTDGPPPQPRWGQSWFPRLDAAAAYAMVLRRGPARIVEVGSGHSTRFLARAARRLGGDVSSIEVGAATITEPGSRPAPVQITCIDPAPRASLEGLDIDWRREVLSEDHLPLFAGLRSGDIAFFDSSHLLWPGSDVDMILNRILPVLRPGVAVHFHDILLPDPYPAGWDWRGYTEQLGLAGYLTNPDWRILWSSHYARTRKGAGLLPEIAALPIPDGAHETSLWLLRVERRR